MAHDKPKDRFDAAREVVNAIQEFSAEDQKKIIKWASEELGLPVEEVSPQRRENIVVSPAEHESDTDPAHFSKPKDIKSFVEGKNPRKDTQFAAVVAYYYQFESPEKKDSITKADLVNATRLADWDRLPRPDQTLVNATNSGLLDRAAQGHYRLNSVGENLVAMVLPNSDDSVTKSLRKKPKKQVNKKLRKK